MAPSCARPLALSSRRPVRAIQVIRKGPCALRSRARSAKPQPASICRQARSCSTASRSTPRAATAVRCTCWPPTRFWWSRWASPIPTRSQATPARAGRRRCTRSMAPSKPWVCSMPMASRSIWADMTSIFVRRCAAPMARCRCPTATSAAPWCLATRPSWAPTRLTPASWPCCGPVSHRSISAATSAATRSSLARPPTPAHQRSCSRTMSRSTTRWWAGRSSSTSRSRSAAICASRDRALPRTGTKMRWSRSPTRSRSTIR